MDEHMPCLNTVTFKRANEANCNDRLSAHIFLTIRALSVSGFPLNLAFYFRRLLRALSRQHCEEEWILLLKTSSKLSGLPLYGLHLPAHYDRGSHWSNFRGGLR